MVLLLSAALVEVLATAPEPETRTTDRRPRPDNDAAEV
jgi:hypothetical protein